jgi:glycosyltransferase involved in cell wall biosynthesis
LKILMLLESLGSGGAERQMCLLASELKNRGESVQVVSYAPGDFYGPALAEAGIDHSYQPMDGRLKRVAGVRRVLRDADKDVVLAFLRGPCFYAELAAIPNRNWGLVVSERVATPSPGGFDLRRQLHRIADCVTTNSHTNRLLVARSAPGLERKLLTLYNAVDLDRFRPVISPGRDEEGVSLAVTATCHRNKNMVGLIRAVALLRQGADPPAVEVDWYGAVTQDRLAFEEARGMVASLGLEHAVRFHPATTAVTAVYHQADAVVLPSFREGLPNAICEAMACGRPILMSRVCDAGALVREGENGFLFEPSDPESIAEAIRRFSRRPARDRQRMGDESRRMAERLFDPGAFADRYLAVLNAAAQRRAPELNHWVPDVPETAVASVAALARGTAMPRSVNA